MNALTKITDTKIAEFVSFYQGGMDAWLSAGKILVELVDADPNAYDRILEHAPMLTPDVLGVFERIGRGVLYPPLAMDASPGGSRLKLLPMSVQRKHESAPVEVVVRKTNGHYDTLMIIPKNMTRAQSKLAFAKDHIRSTGEQRAILADEETKSAPITLRKVDLPWRIRNGRCEFVAGATLSAGELATILTQITK